MEDILEADDILDVHGVFVTLFTQKILGNRDLRGLICSEQA